MGTAMAVNRSAASRKGGNCCRDASMAMKFRPHMRATEKASRRCVSGMARVCGPVLCRTSETCYISV
ncbi:hypothetical protein GCM10027059_29230 [Myceligenerans halotolerans]